MVDSELIPAIKAALKFNEIGTASAYELQFARLGQSGASFGCFQADTNSNPAARSTLALVLGSHGVSGEDAARIVNALDAPLPNANPLSDADLATVNAALSSAAGMALVDAMDEGTLQIVLHEVDECIEAAAPKYLIAPDALCAIACWVNMTGEPTSLLTWLSSASIPSRPLISLVDVMGYLRATTYFRLHPRNILHLQDAVAAGVALLPSV